MDHSIALVVITPFVGAYLIPLLGLWRVKLCYPLTVAATMLAAVFSIRLAHSVLTTGVIRYHVGGWPPPYGIELVADHLSAFMCLTISLIAFLVAIYSKNYIEKDLPAGKTTFYCALILLLIGGMLGAVVTGDLFNLFVLTEIFSMAAYALVPISGKKGSPLASFRYLLTASIGTSLVLLATGYLYMLTGTLNMADLAGRLPAFYDSWVVFAALAFFLVGFGIKAALFPLHTWLPDAHSISPAPVSVLLSALVIKIGAYSIIRILFTVFQVDFVNRLIPLLPALTWVAAAAILMGSIFAISQTDIKRMLAYSSAAHIGYVMLGVGLAVEAGMAGGILHIFNHALAKGCLFFCAGTVIHKTGLRRIEDYRGLGGRLPLTMLAFTLATASMVGVPPTAGFVSKFYLCLGAVTSGRWFFVVVILLGSLITAVFYLRIINLVYFAADGREGETSNDDPSLSMLIPLLTLALASVAFGVFAGVPLRLVKPAVATLLGI